MIDDMFHKEVNDLYNLGCEKDDSGNYIEAINFYNRAIIIYEKNSLNININVGTSIDGELVKISRPFISCIYFNRAEAKYNLDDFQGALDDYSKLLEISPDIPEVFTKRGLVKKALKDINGSYKDLEKAAELGDDEAAKLLKEHCK